MRILQLIDSLDIGGAERMSVNIANVLSENGIESFLVASRKGGPLQQFLLPGVKFYKLNKKNGLDIAGFYRWINLIKQIKPDIIHAHSTSIFWALGMKLFTQKIKVVFHDHYGFSDTLKNKDRFWLKLISKWFNGAIVVNFTLDTWCKNNFNIPRNRIVYLKNFPYLTLMECSMNKEKLVLLNLANLRPQKDQLNLLEAVNIVKQYGIEFELWLAGAYGDKHWVVTVQNRIEDLGLGNEVKMLGAVENSIEVLSKASIGILSSRSEGLPVALLEYGLAGLPVICTNTGQCNEVLGDGKYGVVIPPGDPAALADAIIKLTGNPIETEQMAMAFNKHVIKEYGSENFLAGYLNLVRNII